MKNFYSPIYFLLAGQITSLIILYYRTGDSIYTVFLVTYILITHLMVHENSNQRRLDELERRQALIIEKCGKNSL